MAATARTVLGRAQGGPVQLRQPVHEAALGDELRPGVGSAVVALIRGEVVEPKVPGQIHHPDPGVDEPRPDGSADTVRQTQQGHLGAARPSRLEGVEVLDDEVGAIGQSPVDVADAPPHVVEGGDLADVNPRVVEQPPQQLGTPIARAADEYGGDPLHAAVS